MAKARVYRAQLADTASQVARQQSLAWHAQREDELNQLQGQLDVSLQNLGHGQQEAQLHMFCMEQQRMEKQARAAELERVQQQRFAEALAKTRQDAAAKGQMLDTHKARKEAILRAEREKAEKFSADLKTKSALQQQQRQLITGLDKERRKRNQHSLQDFKYSRIHEQLVVPAADTADPPTEDPVFTAKQTNKRWVAVLPAFLPGLPAWYVHC